MRLIAALHVIQVVQMDAEVLVKTPVQASA